MADRELDGFIKASRFDGTHTIFQHGIVEIEATLLLSSLNGHGVTMDTIHEFFSHDWRTRASTGGSKLKGIFNSARQTSWRDHKAFAPYASESIILVPLLNRMLHTHPMIPKDALRHQISSWNSLNAVCTLYGRAKVGLGRPSDLAEALERHGKDCKRAYGMAREFYAKISLGETPSTPMGG